MNRFLIAIILPESVLGFVYLHELRSIVRPRNVGSLRDYLPRLNQKANWVGLGKMLFDCVLESGGSFWHLAGHFWESEELDLWDDCRRMLEYVSRRDGVPYCFNIDPVKLLPSSEQAAKR